MGTRSRVRTRRKPAGKRGDEEVGGGRWGEKEGGEGGGDEREREEESGLFLSDEAFFTPFFPLPSRRN